MSETVSLSRQNGYVAGVRILSEAQVDRLHEELGELLNPRHGGHKLSHEYHSNNSGECRLD